MGFDTRAGACHLICSYSSRSSGFWSSASKMTYSPEPAQRFNPSILVTDADMAAIALGVPTSSTTDHALPVAPSHIETTTQQKCSSGICSTNRDLPSHLCLLIPQFWLLVIGFENYMPCPRTSLTLQSSDPACQYWHKSDCLWNTDVIHNNCSWATWNQIKVELIQ